MGLVAMAGAPPNNAPDSVLSKFEHLLQFCSVVSTLMILKKGLCRVSTYQDEELMLNANAHHAIALLFQSI